MLQPTDEYKSKNFTASLTEDPSGVWFLDVTCKTEKNGVAGKVVGHIPLCLLFRDDEDGNTDVMLSVMDDVDDEDDKIINFPK